LPSKFFAQVNTEDFIAQAREFESFDSDKLDWIAKFLSGMGQSHPWTVMRAHEFLKWTDSGQYDRILSDPKAALTSAQKAKFCTSCGGCHSGSRFVLHPLWREGCWRTLVTLRPLCLFLIGGRENPWDQN